MVREIQIHFPSAISCDYNMKGIQESVCEKRVPSLVIVYSPKKRSELEMRYLWSVIQVAISLHNTLVCVRDSCFKTLHSRLFFRFHFIMWWVHECLLLAVQSNWKNIWNGWCKCKRVFFSKKIVQQENQCHCFDRSCLVYFTCQTVILVVAAGVIESVLLIV